jgi:hypothetical protein
MFQKNTNTAALSGNSSLGESKWDSKSLELFAIAKKSTHGGSGCKTTSLCNGDLATGANGVSGIEITKTSFLTTDGNNK